MGLAVCCKLCLQKTHIAENHSNIVGKNNEIHTAGFSVYRRPYLMWSSVIVCHLRYDKPAKYPRNILLLITVFLLYIATAVSVVMLDYNISTSDVPAWRMSACTVWRSRRRYVLQEGHLTPYDHVTLCRHMHTERFEILTIWLVLTRNRPRNVRVRLCFLSALLKNRPKPTNFFGKTEKRTEPLFTFGS